MSALPGWVYDLVDAVQQHEDSHRGLREGGTCLAPALDKVPGHVREGAALIAAHKAEAGEARSGDQAVSVA